MAKINVNKVVENVKPFQPEEKYGNMSLGKLNRVYIKFTETPAEKEDGTVSTYDYAGKKLPMLAFEFQQVYAEGDGPDRFHTHYEKPIVITKNDGGLVADKDIEAMLTQQFDRILHIHRAFAKSPNFIALNESNIPEIKETIGVDERLESYLAFYQWVVDSFNNGKGLVQGSKEEHIPIFRNEKNASILLWIKLVANYGDNKYLTFPSFVGRGFLELFNAKYPKPSLMFEGKETWRLKTAATAAAAPAGGSAPANNEAGDDEISSDLKDLIEGK